MVNVAVNKVTSTTRTGSHATYNKWGNKDNLVDGLRTATGSGSGCSGCFASNPNAGHWQVDLGQKYFAAFIRIVGVTGEQAMLVIAMSLNSRNLCDYMYKNELRLFAITITNCSNLLTEVLA